MKKAPGMTIAALGKGQGMTRLDLAEKMGVTDKAVSEWERDLSCPDIDPLPALAESFHISVDELTQIKTGASVPPKGPGKLVGMAVRAVALAMGVAVALLSVLDSLRWRAGWSSLGSA